MKPLVIAIDGPAASGKSTTARLVAEQLGYIHVDTGAMYRAMTLKALRAKVDVRNRADVEELAERTRIRIERGPGGMRVLLDEGDVTEQIRSLEVEKAVSAVSSYSRVREAMVREQRRMGRRGGIVLEGRDIGTVVFPKADLKFYMVANVHERARRRREDLRASGRDTDLGTVAEEILERDNKDSSRAVSPLRKAEDAMTVDTSDLTIEEQVKFIVDRARKLAHRE